MSKDVPSEIIIAGKRYRLMPASRFNYLSRVDTLFQEAKVLLGAPVPRNLAEMTKQAYRLAMVMADGDRETAAKMLDVPERTFYRKLNELGLHALQVRRGRWDSRAGKEAEASA